MTAPQTDPGEQAPARRRGARVILDVVLLLVLVALVFQISSPMIQAGRQREQVRAVGQEARALYKAFRDYRERNGAFPDVNTEPAFDPMNLEPLRRRGYYHGAIGTYLLNGQIDAYDAPDDNGPNREFWLEMTFAADPAVRILIVRSDDAPLGRGNWLDGVFVVRGGTMEELR